MRPFAADFVTRLLCDIASDLHRRIGLEWKEIVAGLMMQNEFKLSSPSPALWHNELTAHCWDHVMCLFVTTVFFPEAGPVA